MDKEKQIEEMTNAIFEHCNAGLFYSEAKQIAHFVIEQQGYRKASEIFEEIDNILRQDEIDYDDLMDSETVAEIYAEYLACSNYIDGIRRQFAELKKKYTEGGE